MANYPISRRATLGLIGAGLVSGAAVFATAKFDLDGDGVATETELQEGLDPLRSHSGPGAMPDALRNKYGLPTDRAYSEQEAAALAMADSNYGSEVDCVLEFIHDDRLQQGFVDTQLEYWMGLPESWQKGVIAADGGNALYLDDWNKNGVPHILPDGSKGPDYGQIEPVNPDGDAFMRRYYNHTATVHDPRSGDYIGFQPGKGDRVGKLGDRNGEGSVAAYLDGDVSGEDLVGNTVSVWFIDYMEGAHPGWETADYLREFFADAPIGDGIDFYAIWNDDPMPREPTTTGKEAIDRYEQQMPVPLEGPVPYALYVAGMKGDMLGVGIAGPERYGGLMETYTGRESNSLWNASVALEEILWHSVGTGTKDYDGRETLTNYGHRELELIPEQWEEIRQHFDMPQRSFYETLKARYV